MSMVKLSVPQAAADLGVSPARVRQRIEDGSLVAVKIGGRWLVDLAASDEAGRPARGRPVSPLSVWYSLVAVDHGALLELPRADLDAFAAGVGGISAASRSRAAARLRAALDDGDHEAILAWLRHRGERRAYVAAPADLPALRSDGRLSPSGVSHPGSGLSDPRMVEAYVARADLDQVADDHWLEPPSLDEHPNVILHAVPAVPPHVGRLLLAADLAEHARPRELHRAHELLDAMLADRREAR
jgi:hypothetical protein